MPVPNDTTFGPRPDGKTGITYGDVRLIKTDDEKIQYLKLRLDTFLINQVDAIVINDRTLEPKFRSPFSLMALTFLASVDKKHYGRQMTLTFKIIFSLTFVFAFNALFGQSGLKIKFFNKTDHDITDLTLSKTIWRIMNLKQSVIFYCR